jgi:hypothetical protein
LQPWQSTSAIESARMHLGKADRHACVQRPERREEEDIVSILAFNFHIRTLVDVFEA